MDIQWFSTSMQGIATIYDTNITLNTVASSNFKTFYTALIGYEPESNAVVIKGITKEEIALGLYKGLDTYPISIKPSYGRINGKKIVDNIVSFFPLDFSKKNYYKFKCEWSQKERLLKIFLDREVL